MHSQVGGYIEAAMLPLPVRCRPLANSTLAAMLSSTAAFPASASPHSHDRYSSYAAALRPPLAQPAMRVKYVRRLGRMPIACATKRVAELLKGGGLVAGTTLRLLQLAGWCSVTCDLAHAGTCPACERPQRTWQRLSRRSARSTYLPHSARISELSVCSCRPPPPGAPPPPLPAAPLGPGEAGRPLRCC